MKTIFITRSVLLFFITILIAGLLQASIDDPALPDVTIVSSSGDYHPYFPSITRLPNGNLVMVYYWNTGHVNTTGGKIYVKVSTNNGEDWSAGVPIVDYTSSGLDSRDPHINVLSNGALILNFFTGKWDHGFVASPYQDHVIETRVAKCTDGTGTNWNEPIIVPTNKYNNATSGAIIELDNGDLLLPTYGSYETHGLNKAYVSISADGGASWTPDIEVTHDDNNGQGYNEMTLGSIRGIIYAITRPSGKIFKSMDNGRTWLIHSSEEHLMHAPDFLKINDSTLFLTYCSGAFVPGNTSRIVYGKMFNPSLDWDATPTKTIYATSCKNITDMGYPASVLTENQKLLTIYYDRHCKGIIGGTFSRLSDW